MGKHFISQALTRRSASKETHLAHNISARSTALVALALVASACSSASPGGEGSVGTAGATGVGGGALTGAGGANGSAGHPASGAAGSSAPGGSGAGVAGAMPAGGAAPTGSSGSGAVGGTAGGAVGGASGLGGSSATGGTVGVAGSAGASGSAGAGGGSGAAVPSGGCSKTPTLKNNGYNTIMSGGASRQYYLRWPTGYDNTHAYRLILDFHGAGGKGTDIAPGFFGLYDLSKGSTIFIAPDAAGGYWSAASDTTLVDDILKSVEADLCIDTSRVELEGFSQGGAMAWTLTCSRPKVFRAVVGHSGGGVANPTTCQPVAYFGSLGLSDISGNSQKTQTDPFAKWNGCTVETLPTAPTGGHICTNYKGCPTAYPVRWCSYDGGHTPSPNDAGKSTSWMPSEVWPFFSQF